LGLDDLKDMIEGHEIDIRDSWEQSRLVGYLSIIPHLKKGSNLTPESLYKFPWEKSKEVTKMPVKEAERLRKLAEIVRNNKMIPKYGKS